jgi:hypothetical protein
MTRAARSVYAFGIYLTATGAILVTAPNILLMMLRLPSTNEPWIHVLGVPVMAMGVLHVSSARHELVPFFRSSARIRFAVLAGFIILAVLRIVPAIVIGFGVVDAGAALWTLQTLKAGAREA